MSTIDSKTKLCAVIGKPVGHSLSPAIHNAAFRHKKLNFVYLAFEVSDLARAVEGVRGLGIRGLSVTIPHKVAIIEHLDELDALAARMGSVNTVVNQEGRLLGSTSDGVGMLRALAEQGVETNGRSALVVGSGGAARACGFSLAAQGKVASITIVDLASRRQFAEQLSREISEATGVPAGSGILESKEEFSKLVSGCDIFLNCTPVGMHPHQEASVLPPDFHRSDLVVFDAVYNPRRTRLLEDAARAGAKTVEGLGMFVHQAAVQFELWTGTQAPVALMREVVVGALSAQRDGG